MTWPGHRCGWVGPDDRRCDLHRDHRPLVAWPHHAPDRLFHLGPLVGTVRYPKRGRRD